jgi:putative aldouronate transport system permease protein
MNGNAVTGTSNRWFKLVVHVILIFCTLCALLPFWMLIASSLSSEASLVKYGYGFWPKEWSLYAYKWLFSTNGAKVMRAYGITFFITIAGTGLSLLITPMLAYPLSRRDYKRAKLFTFVVFFTMLFNGGVVPSYIIWTQLFHIKNTIWAWIFPNLLMSGFYVILYKNYFASNIHPTLIEAAKIDGASEWRIYFTIVLPLSLPILATVGLMTGLGYWNNWTNGLYYITDTRLYSLQQYLKSIIDNITNLNNVDTGGMGEIPSISIRMAIAVVGTVPILLLYPFFQKAFVAGIALGGVKE